jgi:hypothetical protein
MIPYLMSACTRTLIYTCTAVFNQHWYTLDTECVRGRSVWWWRRVATHTLTFINTHASRAAATWSSEKNSMWLSLIWYNICALYYHYKLARWLFANNMKHYSYIVQNPRRSALSSIACPILSGNETFHLCGEILHHELKLISLQSPWPS